MAVSPTHPHSLDWEKIQRKGPHHAGLFVQRLLLQRVDSLGPLWANAKLETLRMADVLQEP